MVKGLKISLITFLTTLLTGGGGFLTYKLVSNPSTSSAEGKKQCVSSPDCKCCEGNAQQCQCAEKEQACCKEKCDSGKCCCCAEGGEEECCCCCTDQK